MKNNTNSKKKAIIWSIGAVILVLALCFTLFVLPKLKQQPEPQENTVSFALVVSVEGEGDIFNSALTVKEGTPLIDIMNEQLTENGGVVVEESEYGAYVTAICGYEQDYEGNLYWLYYVNGEFAAEGVSSYCPQEGDTVLFELAVSSF